MSPLFLLLLTSLCHPVGNWCIWMMAALLCRAMGDVSYKPLRAHCLLATQRMPGSEESFPAAGIYQSSRSGESWNHGEALG